MDGDTLSLGTDVANWAIKDFSVALRQAITEAARKQGCTNAEWLHGYFHRHGIDGQQFEPVKLNAISLAVNGDAVDHLTRLAKLAREVTPPDRDSEAMQLARGMVRDQLRQMAGKAPREARAPRRLPGPRAAPANEVHQ